MDPWIYGEPSFNPSALDDLVLNHFPGAKLTDNYHATLLVIGNDQSDNLELLKNVFLKENVGSLQFSIPRVSLMLGGPDKNLILLVLEEPQFSEAFKRLYDAYSAAGVKPTHQTYPESRFPYGFTPHITIATFDSNDKAKAVFTPENAVEFMLNYLQTIKTIIINNFQMHADFAGIKNLKVI